MNEPGEYYAKLNKLEKYKYCMISLIYIIRGVGGGGRRRRRKSNSQKQSRMVDARGQRYENRERLVKGQTFSFIR